MNKEEKKAINYFKNKIGDFELLYGKKLTTQENEHLKILLNLIEKQQKEIEELKNTETYKIAIIDKDNYVSKDKIKETIKKLENGTYDAKIILQKLLEERN